MGANAKEEIPQNKNQKAKTQQLTITVHAADVWRAVITELPALFVSGVNIRPSIYQQLTYCWPTHLCG